MSTAAPCRQIPLEGGPLSEQHRREVGVVVIEAFREHAEDALPMREQVKRVTFHQSLRYHVFLKGCASVLNTTSFKESVASGAYSR